MKRFLHISLVCLLMLAILAACGNDAPSSSNPPGTSSTNPGTSSTAPSNGNPTDPTDPLPTDPQPTDPKPSDPNHTCQAMSDDYMMDKDNHWQLCECGKILNKEAHKMQEETCRVCSAEIYTDEYDGITYLSMYNEYGDTILCQVYDAEGNLTLTETYAHAYNDQGIRISEKYYIDGNLSCETTWDVWGNMLSTIEYDESGDVINSLVYELTCDSQGNVLTEKHITNGVLTYEATFGYKDDGTYWVVSDIYYLEDGSKEESHYNEYGDTTSKVTYDAQGNVVDTYTFEYRYTNGVKIHERCTMNGKLQYIDEYTTISEDGWDCTYLSQRSEYAEDGSYSVTTYDDEYNVLSYYCYDASGNLLDFSYKFDSTVCAPLFGTWTGTLTMDGEMLGLGDPTILLDADVTITFGADGTMITIIDLDETAYRELVIQFTTQLILSLYGDDMDPSALDAYFQSEFGMTFQQYVQATVDEMDLSEMIHQELHAVYYVEGNLLYTGDNWSVPMESGNFALDGDQLTLEEENLAMVLTKQTASAKPIDPPADLKPHEKFDSNTCAPLFGAWEYTQTMSSKDMGYELEKDLTVSMTVRITFTEDGIQVMQMIVDEQAYFNFMLATTVEGTYLKFEATGMTRQQVDADYASRGTTLVEEVTNQLNSRNLLPDDGYFCFYVENGVLYYGNNGDTYMTEIRFTVNGNAMTFHADGDGEDIILTKVP